MRPRPAAPATSTRTGTEKGNINDEIKSSNENGAGDLKTETSNTSDFETNTSAAKLKKQDMEDTAEMSNDDIVSSNENEAGNFKTEPTSNGDFETETSRAGNFHQNGNRSGDKGEGAGRDKDKKGNARPKKHVKEDTGEPTKDEGAGRGEIFKDKEEANQVVNGCKRLIGKDKEGKMENNERPKTEPGRVARDKGGNKKDINDENLGNSKAKAKRGNTRKDIGDDTHQAGTNAGIENEDIGRGCTAAGVMAEPYKI